MAMSRLVFRIDRDCQRLNRVHVNGCHLLDVFALLGFRTAHFIEPLLVEPIQQMDQTRNQQAKENEWQSRAMNCRNRKERRKRRRQPGSLESKQ